MSKNSGTQRKSRGGKLTATSIAEFFTRKLTLVLVPHSERKAIQFRVNFLLFTLLIAAFVFTLLFLLFSSVSHLESQRTLTEEATLSARTSGEFESVLAEVDELIRVYQLFSDSLQSTLDGLRIRTQQDPERLGSGDIASFEDLQELTENAVNQVYELRRLRDSLSESIEPVGQISSILQDERALLSDLPTLWPVAGGRNVVVQEFGPNIHPIRDYWYLYEGVDIEGPSGLPIVAAANGTVEAAYLDTQGGLGNTIIVSHKYGFRTKYSHLGSIIVQQGDVVSQGQQIGIMGRTGLAVSPFLNFQILLGTEFLDPLEFIKIRNDFSRWLSTRS